MSSTDLSNPPQLLPGMAAASMTWWVMVLRVVAVLVAIGGGLYLGWVSAHKSSSYYLVFAGVLVLLVINTVVTLLYLRREMAEVKAGYTTLHRKHKNLPQLDPRTGDVVREAVQPTV